MHFTEAEKSNQDRPKIHMQLRVHDKVPIHYFFGHAGLCLSSDPIRDQIGYVQYQKYLCIVGIFWIFRICFGYK